MSILRCCDKPIKAKRLKAYTNEGLKVFKVGKCNNHKCKCLNVTIETTSLWGRTSKAYYRGKKAQSKFDEYKIYLVPDKKEKQYKKNTAKGFHYCNTFWDLKKNRIRQDVRELATDRLISRSEDDLFEEKNIKQSELLTLI